MGLNEPIRDSEDEFIDKEIKPLGEGAKDDPPDETAFKNMQEIINANFGGFNGLTKSAYAAQIEEIDKQLDEEKKVLEESAKKQALLIGGSKDSLGQKGDSPGGPALN